MKHTGVKVYKQFETKATSIDEANYTITFKVSDSSVDRDGEIVSQKDWQMKNYLANPVLLFGHDPSKPEYVIGQCVKMEYSPAEDCHFGTYKLDAGFNDTAKLIWNQLVSGTLRTVSLGFINHDYQVKDGVPVLEEVEPLETSIVPIPANAGALAKAAKAGKISEKDARFLVKSMREEAERIETQLKVNKPTEETPIMNEEDQKTLMKSIEALTKGQNAISERLDGFEELAKHKGAVADILNADRGWEVDDEKWYTMQVVAEMYYAFVEAYYYTATPVDAFSELLKELIGLLSQVADGTYKDGEGDGAVVKALKEVDTTHVKDALVALSGKKAEAVEEDGTPKDDVEDEDSKDDPAKGGKDDQPGAGEADEEVEIDDDTELTPELQAQIDAELDAAAADQQ